MGIDDITRLLMNIGALLDSKPYDARSLRHGGCVQLRVYERANQSDKTPPNGRMELSLSVLLSYKYSLLVRSTMTNAFVSGAVQLKT